MTPAERLRRAADVLDERAGKATKGPWRVGAEGSEGSRINPATGDRREDVRYIASVKGRMQPEDGYNAAYIATLSPDVGTLIAAWMRETADRHSPVEWHEADPESDEIDLSKPLPPFCHHCTGDEYVDAVEYGDTIDQGSPVVGWPCPDAESALAVADAILRGAE